MSAADQVRRVLLLVDGSPWTRPALARYLRRGFDEVRVAKSRQEAEELLGAEADPPTHLLCAEPLLRGLDVPSDLFARWRADFPSLQLAAVMSSHPMPFPLEGVDAIFQLALDLEALRTFFWPEHALPETGRVLPRAG